MSSIKLAGLTLAGVGVIGGGVGTVYALNSNTQTPKSKTINIVTTSIRQQITKEQRTVLDQGATTWDIKLHVYTSVIQSQNKIVIENNNEAGLKAWCNKTLGEDFKDSNNENYLFAKQLCTKPTNKEKLQKNSKTLIGENDSEWTKKETAYKSEGKDSYAIPNIGSQGTVTKADIKGWCETTLSKEIADSGSEYSLAEKWCTQ
ncbi:hypothetical protein A6V39_03720 [Candidatus Mycoplasma haematobovis]|uniref:Uncharacterized protein n=1 Tax=Candidatus Mycoplasma haematobovis TaxID=432608 RepID=A0A1A9QDG7_9MOLU|nr:hypothetical protein [Candidatus Mycoplasma haematobovis]OAL09995.1 hypothetical protein A6V39_03720 [Candidatus Mycoplasma haematobovis]